MSEKANITMPATVEKIIKPPDPRMPEKAQITIEQGADPLYRKSESKTLVFTDEAGREVKLKPGAKVEVTVEATASEVTPKHA